MVSGNIFHCRKHSWPPEEYISRSTLHLLEFDSASPPEHAWRRRLNSHANLLREFSVTFREAVKMKAPIDPFTRESCKPSASQGVPLGGMGKPDDHGISSWGWNLGGQHSTYHALFPRAWTIYDGEPDPELKISCRQISPFIPHNYRDSSLPVAVFVYTNSIGGISHLSGDHVNEPFMTAKDNPPVTFAIAACETQNVDVSVLPSFGLTEQSHITAKDMWGKMAQDGHFDRDNFHAGPSIVSSPGDTLCAAVSASTWVEPHGKCTVAFSLAWSSPKVKFLKGSSYNRRYTKFYGTSERSALNLAHDALIKSHLPAKEEESNWDSNHDRSVKVATSVSIKPPKVNGKHDIVVKKDTIDHLGLENNCEDVGRFLYLEGIEYIMWCTYDVHFYASFALLVLFPKIELSIQQDFAKAVLCEDGRKVKFLAEGNSGIRKVRGAVPHDLGTHDPWHEMNAYNIHDTSRWKDLNPKFVLQIYRDFAATGDMSFALDVWPSVRAAMEYMEQFDRDDDGLIENDGFPDQTYDAWTVHGISAYCGCLWLAALEAAAAMAHRLGDKGFEEWCKSKFLKAKPVFEGKLWNGSYFNYDSGSSSNSRSIQADQLAGQWYIASSGLPPIFDDFKIKSALQKIYDFNVMRVRGGRMGAVNGMHPNGKVDESCMQSREIWTGVTYGVAATMILAGMEEQAFATAEGIFTAGWSEEGYGYWFQTPEGWTTDGHYRSLIYMRPLSIWAMQWALSLPKAILEAPGINMMDRLHTSPLDFRAGYGDTSRFRKSASRRRWFGNQVFQCTCK
ncbi:hypothetical protein Sjap_008919 [Stephania japonica]|uniref:NLGase n=1 Tax=Stephania japonica TaxID=461633 RepID=A0AAP0PF40_9MAGN